MKKRQPPNKRAGLCVGGDSVDHLDDGQLQSLLDELIGCRHTGDIATKSPLTQELMRQAEESESGEESIKHLKRQRAKKPRDRRRRRDSGCPSVSVSGCAGGSLDNIASCPGCDRRTTAATRRRGRGAGGDRNSCVCVSGGANQTGVAGRSLEGGSCCNLSRGSFETSTVGRRRRSRKDPHRHHHGSLEDLNAIDEAAVGNGASVGEQSKHGGSLQNIGGVSGGAGGERVSNSGGSGGEHIVIDIGDTFDDEMLLSSPTYNSTVSPTTTVVSRRSTVQPVSAVSPVATAQKRLSLEEGGARDIVSERADAIVNFPLQIAQSSSCGIYSDTAVVSALTSRQNVSTSCVSSSKLLLSGTSTAGSRSTQEVKGTSTRGDQALRRTVPLEYSAGLSGDATPASSVLLANSKSVNGVRSLHNVPPSSSTTRNSDLVDKITAGRLRRAKKKEPDIRTDSVDGYRGHDENVDNLLQFIESAEHTAPASKQKCGRRGTGASTAAGSSRRDGVGRSRRGGGRADDDRRASLSAAAASKRSHRGSGAEGMSQRLAARSSSLEARRDSGGSPDVDRVNVGDTSSGRFCGDLAQSSSSGGKLSPSGVGFPSDDGGAGGDSEFHVVTRRQRRPRVLTASRTVPAMAAGDPGTTRTLSCVAAARSSHSAGTDADVARPTSGLLSDLSDSGDSDGACSLPLSVAVTATVCASPAVVPQAPPSSSSSSLSSWADVARCSSRAASVVAASSSTMPVSAPRTDYIDGVGPIFNDGNARQTSVARSTVHLGAVDHHMTTTAGTIDRVVGSEAVSATSEGSAENDGINSVTENGDSPASHDDAGKKSNVPACQHSASPQSPAIIDSPLVVNGDTFPCLESEGDRRSIVSKIAAGSSTVENGEAVCGDHLENGSPPPQVESERHFLTDCVDGRQSAPSVDAGRRRVVRATLSAPHCLTNHSTDTACDSTVTPACDTASSLVQRSKPPVCMQSSVRRMNGVQKAGGGLLCRLEAQLDANSPVFGIHFGFVDGQDQSQQQPPPSDTDELSWDDSSHHNGVSECGVMSAVTFRAASGSLQHTPAISPASSPTPATAVSGNCATTCVSPSRINDALTDDSCEQRFADSAVDLFCQRFRQPVLNVSRFNWREVSEMLSKV